MRFVSELLFTGFSVPGEEIEKLLSSLEVRLAAASADLVLAAGMDRFLLFNLNSIRGCSVAYGMQTSHLDTETMTEAVSHKEDDQGSLAD